MPVNDEPEPKNEFAVTTPVNVPPSLTTSLVDVKIPTLISGVPVSLCATVAIPAVVA